MKEFFNKLKINWKNERINWKLLSLLFLMMVAPYLPLFYIPKIIQFFFSVHIIFYIFIIVGFVFYHIIRNFFNFKIKTVIMIILLSFNFSSLVPYLEILDNHIIIWWNDKSNIENFSSPILGVIYEKNCTQNKFQFCFKYHYTLKTFDILTTDDNMSFCTWNQKIYKENWVSFSRRKYDDCLFLK